MRRDMVMCWVSRKAAAAGFTLLEVLVALTIIAVALAAALRSAAALTEGTHDLELRIYAQLLASSELAEIRLSNSLPTDADAIYDCLQAGVTFRCHRRIESSPNPFLRWVRVDVADARAPERQLASLAMAVRTGAP
jgi:general secretion pathway protein I